jgi:NADH-quinone oxidoreductase subunit C
MANDENPQHIPTDAQDATERPSGDAPVAEAPQQEAPPAVSPAPADVSREELPNVQPSASASVAAETAAAQDTAGSSSEVDEIPAPGPAPVYRTGMFGVRGSGDTSGFGGLQRRVPVPVGTPKPYGSYFDDIDAALAQAWPGSAEAIEKVVIHRGEMTIYIGRDALLQFLRTLRDDLDLRFELLSAVSGVHYPDDPTGRPLHSVYHLTSMTYRRRIRLEVSVPDEDPHVPSATSVYPTADWQERETWDMFGIVYDGHPGLTRILMPDDWVGHPQRKDYPLGGIPVEYKGAEIPPPDQRRSYA